jgi:mercuric reductase
MRERFRSPETGQAPHGGDPPRAERNALNASPYGPPAAGRPRRLDEQGIDCECRVLGLDNVPRAVVSRTTGGVVKLVAERGGGRVLGVHLLAEGAGDAILAGVYAIEARRTVADLADGWDPYLTIGEAIHLAAVAFTRDPSKLSCCAA